MARRTLNWWSEDGKESGNWEITEEQWQKLSGLPEPRVSEYGEELLRPEVNLDRAAKS